MSTLKKTLVKHLHVFDAIDPSSNLPFTKLFLPFQISYRIGKAFNFNKNEGNYEKVENRVSGRCKEGICVPIRWHPFNNLN